MKLWVWVLAALALLPPAARADTLDLTGRLTDGRGQVLAGQSFRLVLGSDASPRAPGAGRVLRTDAQGRFSLRAPVTPTPRRIRLDNAWRRHDSLLLELGFELDLLGRPALYWVEIDQTRFGPLVGMNAFVAGQGGFVTPLTFHSREHAWSLPDDPRGLRLTSMGAEVDLEGFDLTGGVWQVEVHVQHQRFERR
jgi:hypothetical protein